MTAKNNQARSGNVSRRGVLGALLFTLGGIAGLTLFSRFHRQRSNNRLTQAGLPGTDSIFHPRDDAHLQEWLNHQDSKNA